MWIKVTYNDGSTGSRDYCAPSDGGENWIDQWPIPISNLLQIPKLLIHNRRVWTVVWENLNLDSLFFLQELQQPRPLVDEQGQDLNVVKNYVWIW